MEIGSFSKRILLVPRHINSAESCYVGEKTRKDGHGNPI